MMDDIAGVKTRILGQVADAADESALENLRVAAIILSIIAMVLIAEFLSGYLRAAVNRAK